MDLKSKSQLLKYGAGGSLQLCAPGRAGSEKTVGWFSAMRPSPTFWSRPTGTGFSPERISQNAGRRPLPAPSRSRPGGRRQAVHAILSLQNSAASEGLRLPVSRSICCSIALTRPRSIYCGSYTVHATWNASFRKLLLCLGQNPAGVDRNVALDLHLQRRAYLELYLRAMLQQRPRNTPC